MAQRVVSEAKDDYSYQPSRGRRSALPSGRSDVHEHRKLRIIVGILAVLAGIYLTISLISFNKWDPSFFTFSDRPVRNYGGPVGAYVADLIMALAGLPGYLLPLFLFIYGLRKIMGSQRSMLHVLGSLLFIPALAMLMDLISKTSSHSFDPAGGLIGVLLAEIFRGMFSIVGAYIFCAALIAVSIVLLSPVSLYSFIDQLKKKRVVKEPPPEPAEEVEPDFYEDDPQEFTIREMRPKPVMQTRPVVRKSDESGYQLPSVDFLKDADDVEGPTKDELISAASGLERKMADFGVSGKIKQAHPGPVVTMFEFEPAPGVKINRIVSLADDLALALRAPSIRVYPIPGKATIGLEVPNRQRATVVLKEIISSETFQKSSSQLTLALGKDIFGNPVVSDLARMPHLLVAGATGSGKSVSINTMITSLLYKATPNEVKMLMIDPKLLELSAYSDIPHLISPVITSPKEASEALKKMVLEMERRYRLLAEQGTRNIEAFNRQVEPSERLPYIVVFIDELADLMFTAPADVENAIARLAQMARASGIHLILATQRPSVDVITGLIKANFPARISFQVTSKIDSRTILDSMGAEKLLGMGDMLYMIPGVKIVRIHGAFISDTEVKDITKFVKNQGVPDYAAFESIVVADNQKGGPGGDERDEMYQNVVDFAESVGEVSISSIQRRFKIGYNKAATIMELLEEDGFVGPPKGAGKPRDFIRRRQ
ncbi:MAG TPA: DNA translocase FtsK [Dissulfurispiraceae bacterium]|nr:DNA translocase FtsK [Dissulfurispiraceae bacterium]